MNRCAYNRISQRAEYYISSVCMCMFLDGLQVTVPVYASTVCVCVVIMVALWGYVMEIVVESWK